MAAKIKKGDKVIILTGKAKGKTGEVLRVLPQDSRAVVQGVNLVKRHQRASMNGEAGIIIKEASIHLSNIALADPKDGKATRVKFETKDGKKQRIAVRSGQAVGEAA